MLTTIAIVIVYLILQMIFVWVLYKITNNPSIVDSSWSIGLMIAGFIYLFSTPINQRKLIIAVLLSVWALRLSGYIWWTRLRLGHQDKRYTALSSPWKISQSLGFFLNFQIQALLIFLISFMFFLTSLSDAATLSTLDIAAIIIVLTGIAGESIADLQLQRFKRTNSGKVCNIGLWYYSRHPNYFFDWLTWFGFALFAVTSTFGCVSFLSLMALYIIFTRITGPMTERGSIQSRGNAYLQYQATTSMFVPWFKR